MESAPWEWKGDDRYESLQEPEWVRFGTWVDGRKEELFGRRGSPEINRKVRRQR